MTPAGIASVSIRESPAGMTDAEFTRLVMAGMERAAPASVIAGRVEPPFPSQRIVWHVNLSAPRVISRLVVNVFDGANPYAYEQDTVSNDASAAVVTFTVEGMSERLLADLAARANMLNQLGKQVTQNGEQRMSEVSGANARDRPDIGGSCRVGKDRVCLSDPVEPMPKPGTERAVVDRAADSEQQAGTTS
jgi:hypothetical protein